MSLIIDLSPEKEAELEAAARAQGISAEQWLERVVEERLQTLLQDTRKTEQCRPLHERIREIWASMPEEVRADYPDPYRIDHRVYGLPEG